VGTALGTTAVLLVSGVALYVVISRALWTQFDDALAARARSLTALAEQEDGILEFELTEMSLPEFEPSPRAEVYQVWGPDGTVFARSPSLGAQSLPRFGGGWDTPEFRGEFPGDRPGRLMGLVFVPRQEDEDGEADEPMAVTLVLGRDTLAVHATLARLRGWLVSVCLGAVVVSAGVLAWVVRRGLRPVHSLARRIDEVDEDGLGTRIESTSMPAELEPIIDRLNDLLTRLDRAFQRERRFTGDVAHELRNPLAGFRAKLELALSRDRTPEDYRSAMRDCLAINLQMQRMVENLLHLARADAGQLDVRRECVDVSELVQECWAPLRGKAKARGLRVEWDLLANGSVSTDREKLRLVVQNILDNAVSYVDESGRVSVSTAAENGLVVLTASNTGCRLSAAEFEHVFDRFWRGDSSFEAGQEGHCGLGLALCRTLIAELGGSIRGTSTADGVYTIVASLPRED
jgi:two-component system sensor histidine kinase QseC